MRGDCLAQTGSLAKKHQKGGLPVLGPTATSPPFVAACWSLRLLFYPLAIHIVNVSGVISAPASGVRSILPRVGRQQVQGREFPGTEVDMTARAERLADALEAQNDWTDAEKWRRFVIDAATRNHPDDGTRRAGALCALGHNLLRQNRPPEAEASLSDGLSLYKDSDRSESWPRWNAQGLLAEAISADPNRYAEAEPLLLECAEQLASAPEENERARSRVAEARLRLADLYRAWGKRQEETKWRSLTGATD